MTENDKKTRAKKDVQKAKITTDDFKKRLKILGLTKEAFAKVIGVDGQTVRGWKQGEIPLYAEKFIELLEIMAEARQIRDIFEKIYQNNIKYESAKLKQLRNSGNS